MNWGTAIALMFLLYAIVYWIRWWRDQRFLREWLKELLNGIPKEKQDVDSIKEGGGEDRDNSPERGKRDGDPG